MTGFFAVFKKNKETNQYEFVDRWLNARADQGWIERTVTAMGWSPMDVAVVYYYAPDLILCGFDTTTLALKKFKKVKLKQKKVDSEELEDVDGVEPMETFQPQVWFRDGELKRKYEA